MMELNPCPSNLTAPEENVDFNLAVLFPFFGCVPHSNHQDGM
jgi:hypothetical protein